MFSKNLSDILVGFLPKFNNNVVQVLYLIDIKPAVHKYICTNTYMLKFFMLINCKVKAPQ